MKNKKLCTDERHATPCDANCPACLEECKPRHTPTLDYGNFDEALMNAPEITQKQRENIVRAVNAYEQNQKSIEELRKALNGMLEWAKRVKGLNPGMEVADAAAVLMDHSMDIFDCDKCDWEAIAKAEEK